MLTWRVAIRYQPQRLPAGYPPLRMQVYPAIEAPSHKLANAAARNLMKLDHPLAIRVHIWSTEQNIGE